MTQEEKNTLLVDLCTRLPYDIKVWVKTHDNEIIESDFLTLCNGIEYYSTLSYDGTIESSVVMPYLRPMSSMTEDEIQEYKTLFRCIEVDGWGGETVLDFVVKMEDYIYLGDILNWLNAHHFDYRGLIDKGLALEAPEGMYNIKTE